MNPLKLEVKERIYDKKNVNATIENETLDIRFTDKPQSVEIETVQFSIFSAEELIKYSVALINESRLSGEGTIYDERLGVIHNYNRCVTCKAINKDCPGHFGHIELSYPVCHPLFVSQIILYLNLFCSKCHKLCIKEEEFNATLLGKYRGFTRTQKLSQYIQSSLKKCSHCQHKGLFYVFDENNIYTEENKKITSLQIKQIFEGITPKEMKMIGCSSKIHPTNLILTVLPVLPSCARPFVETPNGLCDDDLTNKYVEIIKINNKLKNNIDKATSNPLINFGESPARVPNDNSKIVFAGNRVYCNPKQTEYDQKKEFLDVLRHLEFHIKTLMDNSKGKARQINGRPLKCFRERLNGKTGLFRNNLSGKRVDFSARTVIGPDPTLKANEIAIPNQFASKLTFPERVSMYNLEKMNQLLRENKVNYVIRPADKKDRNKKDADSSNSSNQFMNPNNPGIFDINVHQQRKVKFAKKKLTVEPGDIIIRNNKKIHPETWKQSTGFDVKLEPNDRIFRNGKFLEYTSTKDPLVTYIAQPDDRIIQKGVVRNPNDDGFTFCDGDTLIRNKEHFTISVSPPCMFQLRLGDIVERHLQNGDLVLFGRQPTLHKGSMIARNIRLINENSGVNNGQPIKTIRMNLAATKTYNADFDGDECNIYIPQSYQTKCELEYLSSTEALIKSGQYSRLLLCICQDALTGGFIATRGEFRVVDGKRQFFDRVTIDVDTFNDCIMCVQDWDMSYISSKMDHIRQILKWKKLPTDIYNGHGLFSMLLPFDFEYSFAPTNLKISNGVMLSGYLNKQVLGDSLASIVHKLDKEYGAKIAVDFVSNYQFLINHFLLTQGFSIGLQDCVVSNDEKIRAELVKCFIEAQSIINTESDPEMKEKKINNCLNNATSVGQKISKESMDFDNSLNCMVISGGKGSYVNIAQITGIIGQQNVDGKRIPKNFGNRTLPHYLKNDDLYLNDMDLLYELFESRGFVTTSYLKGLNPKQLFFHAAGGREGVIDTAIKTAKSGYIQRKLVKKMEDLKISYAGYVVNAKNSIIQFNYGNNFDPSRFVKTNGKMSFVNIGNLTNKLNEVYEFKNCL